MGIQINGTNDTITTNDGTISIDGSTTLTGSLTGTTGTFSGDVGVAGTLTSEDKTNIDSVGLITARTGIKVGPITGVAATHYADGSIRTTGIITASSFSGSGANLTGISAGPSLANGSNDRVVTATGANALNGEANLTYDGDTVSATRSANSAGGLLVTNTNNSQGSAIAQLELSAGDNAHARVQFECNGKYSTIRHDGNGHLTFFTDGSNERVRIKSDGDILIGTTTSAGKLTVDSGTSNTCATFQSSDVGAGINLTDDKARSSLEQNGTTLKISSDVDGAYANSDIRLQVDGSSKMTVYSDGRVKVPDGGKFVAGDGDDLQIHHTSSVNHIRSHNGDVVIGTQGNHRIILGAYYNAGGGGDTVEVWGGANFLPATNDAIDLGENSHKWDDIYATNGTIQTSDQHNKDNIATSDLGLSFINKLSPKSYKFKGRTRTHYGLIAQDVETVLSDISKLTSDFAGFIKTDVEDDLYDERDQAHNRIPSGKAIGDIKLGAHTEYGLRYTEFIGPLIKAVQELSAKVSALESS